MSDTDTLIICALGLTLCATELMRIEKNRRRSRRKRARQRQRLAKKIESRGVKNMLQRELRLKVDDSYKSYLRMDERCFNSLLTIVQCRISRVDTCMRESISAHKRLSLTLRFLATGETFESLSHSTRIARNIIKLIVVEVLTSIAERLASKYLRTPQREAVWLKIADQYYKKWNFPNCLGALDGKHIVFKPPRSSDTFNTNDKETDSIVLLALVSANYQLLAVDIGINGRIKDGGVFSKTLLSNTSSENSLDIPPANPLPGREMDVPYVVIAGDAFPLKEYIMKPYRWTELSNEQRIYNFRINRALKSVETAFGILSNRFRILLQPINLNVTKVELITKVCCMLHNFLLFNSKNYLPTRNENINCSLQSIVQEGGNQTRNAAVEIRNEFQTYFNTCRQVPEQNNSIQNYVP